METAADLEGDERRMQSFANTLKVRERHSHVGLKTEVCMQLEIAAAALLRRLWVVFGWRICLLYEYVLSFSGFFLVQ